MGTATKWQYISQKVDFAARLAFKRYEAGEISFKDIFSISSAGKLFDTKMTYFYCNKGVEMESTLSPQDTLFVRKFAYTNAREHREQMNVGDVVILKDPVVSGNHLVRRLAAVGGCEMVSANNDDKPFVMKPGQAWVLSDNKRLNPKESKDSRLYGPIWMSDILGRVIYRFRTPDDQGLVNNSEVSMKWDLPVYSFELDREEMQRFTDKQKRTRPGR